jgi:hypothetical protein
MKEVACVLGVFVLLMGWLVWTFVREDRQRAEKKAAENAAIMAKIPHYQSRAVALFEQLDTDNDGLLHEEELRNHHLDGKFTGQDKDVVAFLYNECHNVGHSVGMYRSGKFTYSVYGISRVDLKLLTKNASKLWGDQAH